MRTETHPTSARNGDRKALAALTIGEHFRGTYLLNRVEMKKARTGKDYLHLEISDPTGALAGNMFDATADQYRSLQGLEVVEAVGEVQSFNDKRSARFVDVKPAAGPFNIREFLPRTPKDVRQLYDRLLDLLNSIRSAHIRKLVLGFLEDPAFRGRFLETPAAVTNHHAYLGGLLEHIVSLGESCARTCEAYPTLDRDLMIAGAFLHDIGKVDELSVERGLDYTDRGRLHGHIVTGVLWIEERARRIDGFPPAVLDHLKHLILSHHGELEWGSPILPMTAEAIALHTLDNLDAKLWAFDKACADAKENGSGWTEWSKIFGRRMFKGRAQSA
ncbi:MAG TPA: HD domain-containing protein [Planctomycetota bacterium]|nr:HD domain-containing protein [Planctomycetota bacterium]